MHLIGRIAIASHTLPLAALALPEPRWMILSAWAAVQAGFMWNLLHPGSRLFAPNLRRGEGSGDGIALSFDDGPMERESELLLDRLDRADVKAAFFFVGSRARALPRIVRRAAAEGHTVGNHTLSHPHLWAAAGRRRVLAEVGEAQAVLSDIIGAAPRWFRPPMGHKNVHLAEALERHGLRQVTWSLRSWDTLSRDPERVRRRLLTRAKAGDIVLLHEGLAGAPSECGLAVELIDPLLEGLALRGLRAVSLRSLLPDPPAPRAASGSREPGASDSDARPRRSLPFRSS